MSYQLSLKLTFKDAVDALQACHNIGILGLLAPKDLSFELVESEKSISNECVKEVEEEPNENLKATWVCNECVSYPCLIIIEFNKEEGVPYFNRNMMCVSDALVIPNWKEENNS